MKFKVVEKANPQNRAKSKWYANAINAGKLTIRDFAKEISGRSSLTRGDVENVLNNFTDELPTFLKLGMSVKLGEFGTLRLTLSSEGTENREDFNASKITGVRVIFTPSAELKKLLEDISLEEQK